MKTKKIPDNEILKRNKLYFMRAYPGAEKYAEEEFFTLDNDMHVYIFMAQWQRRKKIPSKVYVWFHIVEVDNKFKRYKNGKE